MGWFDFGIALLVLTRNISAQNGYKYPTPKQPFVGSRSIQENRFPSTQVKPTISPETSRGFPLTPEPSTGPSLAGPPGILKSDFAEYSPFKAGAQVVPSTGYPSGFGGNTPSGGYPSTALPNGSSGTLRDYTSFQEMGSSLTGYPKAVRSSGAISPSLPTNRFPSRPETAPRYTEEGYSAAGKPIGPAFPSGRPQSTRYSQGSPNLQKLRGLQDVYRDPDQKPQDDYKRSGVLQVPTGAQPSQGFGKPESSQGLVRPQGQQHIYDTVGSQENQEDNGRPDKKLTQARYDRSGLPQGFIGPQVSQGGYERPVQQIQQGVPDLLDFEESGRGPQNIGETATGFRDGGIFEGYPATGKPLGPAFPSGRPQSTRYSQGSPNLQKLRGLQGVYRDPDQKPEDDYRRSGVLQVPTGTQPSQGFGKPESSQGLVRPQGQQHIYERPGIPLDTVDSQENQEDKGRPDKKLTQAGYDRSGLPQNFIGPQVSQGGYERPVQQTQQGVPDLLGFEGSGRGQQNTEKTETGFRDGGLFEGITDQETEGDYSSIPGEPDRDYPVLSNVPNTLFQCDQQEYPGYYADIDTRCQVFHICTNNKTYDFLCPNGTIFHQEYLVCVWWHQFDCNVAPSLYNINANIYDYSIMGARQTGAIPVGESLPRGRPDYQMQQGSTQSGYSDASDQGTTEPRYDNALGQPSGSAGSFRQQTFGREQQEYPSGASFGPGFRLHQHGHSSSRTVPGPQFGPDTPENNSGPASDSDLRPQQPGYSSILSGPSIPDYNRQHDGSRSSNGYHDQGILNDSQPFQRSGAGTSYLPPQSGSNQRQQEPGNQKNGQRQTGPRKSYRDDQVRSTLGRSYSNRSGEGYPRHQNRSQSLERRVQEATREYLPPAG